MAVYDGTVDSTGWSPTPLEYVLSSNKSYGSNGSYTTMRASWFIANWWTAWEWAKKFKNPYPMRVKLNSMTFKCCTGHSNGKNFAASSGNIYNVVGIGCTFYVALYKEGSKDPFAISEDCVLNPIDKFNCFTPDGGAGAASTVPRTTGFGRLQYFGPNTANAVDSQGRPRYPVDCTLKNFKDPNTGAKIDVSIEPGQGIFVVLRTKNWTASINKGLLIIDSASSNWVSDIEPEETDYIWVFNGTKWVKERAAYQLNSNRTWKKLD